MRRPGWAGLTHVNHDGYLVGSLVRCGCLHWEMGCTLDVDGYVFIACASPYNSLAVFRSCTHIQNLHRGSTRTSRQEILDASMSNHNSEACISTPITPTRSSGWREDAKISRTAVPNSYEDRSQGQLHWCRLL